MANATKPQPPPGSWPTGAPAPLRAHLVVSGDHYDLCTHGVFTDQLVAVKFAAQWTPTSDEYAHHTARVESMPLDTPEEEW